MKLSAELAAKELLRWDTTGAKKERREEERRVLGAFWSDLKTGKPCGLESGSLLFFSFFFFFFFNILSMIIYDLFLLF